MPDPTPPAWTAANLADPHHVADKRARVQRMFAAIAPKYDLNNRLHSFWRDQAWRRKAVRLAELKPDDVVVDVACGTGDLTLKFALWLWYTNAISNRRPRRGQVTGIDFTYPMLPIAVDKARRTLFDDYEPVPDEPWPDNCYGYAQFVNGDAQQLPLPDACCDVVSIAFGIRNVQDVPAAMGEFHRVLRPGGRLIVLEFSEPANPILRALNRFYCGKVMPLTATLVSGDKTGAYKYLPKSVETFMTRQQMSDAIAAAGFSDVTQHPMTFGVCVCYRGLKAGS
jgi:demethylmenaquinone methyltransferase/2-methoxy-6-polyprenyl-1,4-benzoquinol methylase